MLVLPNPGATNLSSGPSAWQPLGCWINDDPNSAVLLGSAYSDEDDMSVENCGLACQEEDRDYAFFALGGAHGDADTFTTEPPYFPFYNAEIDVELCAGRCLGTTPGIRQAWFGLTNGSTCYCEFYFDPSSATPLDAADCQAPCPGNSAEACGGENFHVYAAQTPITLPATAASTVTGTVTSTATSV